MLVMLTRSLLILALLSLPLWALPGEHLQPGLPLPEVREADQFGKQRTLTDLKGRQGILLVVFRSADW